MAVGSCLLGVTGGLFAIRGNADGAPLVESLVSPPLVESVVNRAAIPSFFGTYSTVAQDGLAADRTRYSRITVGPDHVRCNHSNHSNDWHEHRYGVVYAKPDDILLSASGGTLQIHRDSTSNQFSVEANGICLFGVENPYTLTPTRATGAPWVLLHGSLRATRSHRRGDLNQPLTFPFGTLTLKDIRRSRWTAGDGDSAEVVELRIAVTNTADGVVDLYLPSRLRNQVSTEGWVSAECGPDREPATGEGNPNHPSHRTPALDRGVYTIFGGHTDLSLPRGERREGWITLLMRSRPENPCVIHIDALGLGGGVVDYTHSFESN
ncbi:MAG: hypothetical protein IT379_42245 [Deltaproteobacteria bacterium]|nr:hypothetical protein [Deltaproteobacteria bacterium]